MTEIYSILIIAHISKEQHNHPVNTLLLLIEKHFDTTDIRLPTKVVETILIIKIHEHIWTAYQTIQKRDRTLFSRVKTSGSIAHNHNTA